MFKFMLQGETVHLEDVAAPEKARKLDTRSPLDRSCLGAAAGPPTRAPSLPIPGTGKMLGDIFPPSSQMVAVAFYPVTIHQVRVSTDQE